MQLAILGVQKNVDISQRTLGSRVVQVEKNDVHGYHTDKKCTPLGPYRRPVPRVLGGS